MQSSTSLITRSEEPLNLEMPFASLDGFLTPNEQFYVRCHFPVPRLDPSEWSLRVEGAVQSPLQLRLPDLQAMPQQTMTVTMECAGNGRSHLHPAVKGVAWDIGAVGTAEWTGVLLRDFLAQSGANETAVEVILEGADRGPIKEPPRPPDEISYARSLPIAKAAQDVLLALAMNGEPLSAEHGFPLRAVVPGWFGMASVKWLQRIIVTEQPFHGYYQSIDYAYWSEQAGIPELIALREMQVKAQIARPAAGEVLPRNTRYRVFGAAWSAAAPVTKVEFSADAGASWNEAQLLGEPLPGAWRFWEYDWTTPVEAGLSSLMARATDEAGRTQPRERILEYGTYVVNHVLPIEVEVR